MAQRGIAASSHRAGVINTRTAERVADVGCFVGLGRESIRVSVGLIQSLTEATVRANAASEAFTAIMSDIPSGIPHPDGIQRIHSASRELSTARKEMMKAHSRLHDFLSRGIIPEDLKRSGS